MNRLLSKCSVVSLILARRGGIFRGFQPPTSNTTYTPNQFFDVCIPHYSRGVVRLVAYMIRKTLGWCDRDGNPQNEQILASYSELVDHAGISRDMIRQAIDQAVAGQFIRCVRPGRRSEANVAAVKALYELNWDEGKQYIKDPKIFKGFYEGEANRTDIPNQFFDDLIPHETLAVIKVVGAIIRFSIGFVAHHGRRRQQVKLSYNYIQHYSRVKNRSTLSQAIQEALDRNYIVRIHEGLFSFDRKSQVSTTYALKWLDRGIHPWPSRKNGPEGLENQSEIRTRGGQENGPDERSEKWTTIEIKQVNDTLQMKQQQPAEGEHVVAAEFLESFQLLKKMGFSIHDAKRLATAYPQNQIHNQINWLERRSPRQNPLGMLRRAIEEDWTEPAGEKVRSTEPSGGLGKTFAAHFYAGYHDNSGDPIADPSAHDIETAERFVVRLLAIWPDETQVAEWGWELGREIKREHRLNENAIPSFVMACRAYGDEFFRRHQAKREAIIHMDIQQAREAHRERFKPMWLDHLRQQEERFKRDRPDDYANFEKHRAEERGQLIHGPWQFNREKRLAEFDTERRRLQAFQIYFQDNVLGFDDWDQQLNPEAFNEKSITP